MYTEFHFRAHLKEDGSADALVQWLKDEKPWDRTPFNAHEFFQCDRWSNLFCSGGAVYQQSMPYRFTMKGVAGSFYNELFIHSSFKHYGHEIELFLDWIDPFVDAYPGDFLGYSLYEESETPTLYFKKGKR